MKSRTVGLMCVQAYPEILIFNEFDLIQLVRVAEMRVLGAGCLDPSAVAKRGFVTVSR